jgi:hypothetical protein
VAQSSIVSRADLLLLLAFFAGLIKKLWDCSVERKKLPAVAGAPKKRRQAV